MSGFDVFTDCQKGCIKPVMKSIGCDDTDFKCFCSKDVPSNVGLQMATCMLTNCLSDSADANFGSALVEACKKVGVTVSAGSDILGGLGGATSTSSSEQTAASSRPTSTPGQNSYGSSATSTSSQTSQTSEPPTSESTGSDNRDGAASKSSGLSAGAAAGIGVAGAVIAMLLIIGAFLFWRRRGRAAKAVRDAGVMSAAGGSELAGTGIHEAYGSYTHTPEVEAKHPSAVSSPSPIKPSHTMVYELQGTMPETGNHTRDVAHQPQMPQ